MNEQQILDMSFDELRDTVRALLSASKAAAPFQSRVHPWMLECFGPEIAADKIERNHRFFEEATEAVQANGMTRSEAHQLVDYTFDRPIGELHQEIGGVMVTLAALCLASGQDMHAAGETELARIWTKVEAIRAKQAAKPKHSPLPAAPSPAQTERGASFELALHVAEQRLRQIAKLMGEGHNFIDRGRTVEIWADQARAALQAAPAVEKLTVWYDPMPESNGKTNWTAILHRGDLSEGHTIARSEYPDRVRYESDCVRWLIGELAERPWILDYDADKHSGYVSPQPAQSHLTSNVAESNDRQIAAPQQAADAPGMAEPVAWRYLTPTGWHATTKMDKALGASAHHDMEPLYAATQPVAQTERALTCCRMGCDKPSVCERLGECRIKAAAQPATGAHNG